MTVKPEAGQWWRDLRDDDIVNIVTVSSAGDVCVCDRDGHFVLAHVTPFHLNYEYLPECDGWDWKPQIIDRSNAGLLGALVNLRDNMDRLNKRVEKLEQASIPYQTIGGSLR